MTDDQSVNNDRPTYRDLQSLYEASVVRARQLEGGQGESSGPSFLSRFRREIETRGELLAEQARLFHSRMWADGANVPLNTDTVGQMYRPAFGSQQRTEMPRWTDSTGSTFASRSLTLADLRRTFNEVNSFRETTRERGEQMRFSGQPDPLTEEDKRKLEIFYAAVLKNGCAQYPLNGDKISLYINGTHKRIFGDPRWSIQSEYIYIGYSQDQGSEDFAEPMYRLACISALMGITGHANKPELIALLSERLAKVMAGVYDTVVKPLATTSDSRPVRRMAWSTGGGLATWLDGAWIGMTGEPVAVGPDWVVVDTNEGPIEDGLPAVGAAVVEAPATNSVPPRSARAEFEELTANYGTYVLPDGRRYVTLWYDDVFSCNASLRRLFPRATQLIPFQLEDGRWVITYSIEEPTPLTHAQWGEIKERFDRWASRWFRGRTPDGRVTVRFGGSRSELEDRIAREGLTGCVVDFNSLGEEAITYPIEPPADVHPL